MIKYSTSYPHNIYVAKRFHIKVFHRSTAYEFLAGLFDCYHSCFKVSPVTLRDGENQAVS